MLTKIADLENREARELARHVTLIGRLDAYLEGLNEPRPATEHTIGTFTAGGLGSWCGKSLCGNYTIGCQRKLWYRYTGVEARPYFDPRGRRVVNLGTDVHTRLDAYCKAMTARTDGVEQFWPETRIYPGIDDELGVATNWEVKVRLDGLYQIWVSDPEQVRFSLEFKTMKDEHYSKLRGPKPEHVTQLIVGMACQDTPIGLLVYYNKNDSAMMEWRVPFDHDHWEAVKAKIRLVRKHAVQGTPPEREGGYFPCRYCDYSYTCQPAKRARSRSMSAAPPTINFSGEVAR